MRLPADTNILLSIVNMKLRDSYSDIDELCASEDIDKTELISRLHSAGFEYIPGANQFR